MSLPDFLKAANRKKLLVRVSALAVVSLVAIGIMASNGWFPATNPVTGERTGWFGAKLAKNAPSSWNPIAMPSPTPTPQLAVEYLYAGSRLLAVEHANANAAPPADLAVWRPSNGHWYVLGGVPGSNMAIQGWGVDGDTPVPGDYDGDGKTDFSIFRPSNSQWFIIYSGDNTFPPPFAFGTAGDKPAQADYDGDGRTDAAVFRPSNNNWYVLGTANGFYYSTWGEANDVPVSADYDGDGKADIALWRSSNSTFYSIDSSDQSLETVPLGIASASTNIPVPADYDGDGKADYAVFNSANANWHIRKSTSPTPITTTPWGIAPTRPSRTITTATVK